MPSCSLARAALLATVLCLPLTRLRAQTHAEVIRGRVTTDSGRAITGAEVIATMAPNRDVFRASSDSGGRYQINVAAGTGDYLVYIAAPGRKAFRKRVTRAGPESTFVVDARLGPDVTVLTAVRSTAQRTRPPRGDQAPSAIGGLTSQYATVSGALSPDQMGDLNAMAATVPGVTITPDGGVSVFGVDPGQNKTSLNGLAFDGSSLPRDLATTTHVASSVYDPTIGGFGGALISVDIRPGQTLTLGEGHVTLDAPQLQAADATARNLGQPYTNLSASYQRSGELQQDTWVYRGAVQGTQRMSTAPSILRSDAAALARLGVARDSADHFLQLLDNLGIPNRVNGIGGDVTSTNLSGAFRLDRALTYPFGGAPPDTKVHVALVGIGNYRRSDPSAASALAPPAHDNHVESGNGSLQAIVSQYFGADAAYLSETKMALSYNTQQSNPYLALPSGSVRVASVLSDGTDGISGLQFGGAASSSDTRSWRWEANNELSFSPIRAVSHRIKFYSQAQVDGYNQTAQTNALGAFSYNSLADLAANSPASYSRTLYSPDRTGGEASGAFALADYWNKSPDLQFVFGPRLEWNAFTQTPRNNPEIARVFGVNTNVTPSSVGVSPRFGFNWLYRGLRSAGRGGGVVSGLGSEFTPPRGVLRGGFGEFRGPLTPSLVSDAIASTGLPGSTTERLTCVGLATPIPDWQDYLSNQADIPASCANGIGSSAFTDAAPSVQLFDPSYTAPRRWTGNLGWSSAYDVLSYTFDASYSRMLDQPSYVNLNYTGVPKFTLSDEANRPVYVSPTSIVPTTGLVSPIDSRASTEFGSVIERRSDLRSDVKQATVTLIPYFSNLLARFMVNGSYTYASSRNLTRGYDGATFGDPRQLAWTTGFMPQHQVRFALGYRIPKINSSFTTYWGLQSGYPYTPIVAGDINGDGLSNDRAFVFDPAHAPDAALASDMTKLLTSTTSEARDCLQRQLGEVAGVNSCRRPWTATMNARFDWNKRFGDNWHYVYGSINFANPLSGIDEMLHGSNHLRGWGAPAAPDPTLYVVRGFDPATQRFDYEVNPRFGNTRPSLGALLNPFRITLDITVALNGNVQLQQLNTFMRPTRGAPGVRPPEDTILRRLRSTGITPASPYFWIIANSDSLLLTPAQLAAIQAGQNLARVRVDSIYKALATELASLPPDYKPDVVARRIVQVNQSIFNTSNNGDGALIGRVLTKIQFRLLPANFAKQFDIRVPTS